MKVCIEQTPEGYQVYDEMNPEVAEMAASVDEAVELARSMLGGAESQEAEPMMEGEAEFRAGFDGARGGQEF